MSDPVTLVLAGRAVERVLITCFGGIALVLGWHLFKLGVLEQQHGEFAKNSFTFKLTAGPGAFFALFGTIIFIAVMRQPVSADYVQSVLKPLPAVSDVPKAERPLCGESTPTVIQQTKINDATAGGEEEQVCLGDEDLEALATSIPLVRQIQNGKALSDQERFALTRATNELSGLQSRAILQRFPDQREHYAEWQDHGGTTEYLEKFAAGDRQRLLTVKALFSESYLKPVEMR